MSPAEDFLGLAAGEDFGNVVEADVEISRLADPDDAAEQLLDIDGGVPFLARAEAVVAAAAIFGGPDLAEISEQPDATAGVALREMRHLVELVTGDLAGLLVGDVVEELEVFHHIAAGEEQEAIGG